MLICRMTLFFRLIASVYQIGGTRAYVVLGRGQSAGGRPFTASDLAAVRMCLVVNIQSNEYENLGY